MICYLTVNRTVGYVRVLYQPVGGFYPVVIAPPNGNRKLKNKRISLFCFVCLFLLSKVNRIKMDFSATRISTQDFTPEQIQNILADAKKQIEEEQRPIISTK